MQWTDDARAALAKAPFFVRGVITKRVEAYVRKNGREAVTLADMKHVREVAGMPADQIEKLVRESRPQAFADERTYQVGVCGLPDCPRRIFDVHALAEKMAAVIDGSGVPEAVARRAGDEPVLRHHRLIVSISGCPNSCSQPQIADFGVQGRARPIIGPGDCTGCGCCVGVCREEAVTVSCQEPALDTGRCVDCGDCAAACPAQALAVGQIGFTALVGGKLGRNPLLARTLFDFTDESILLTALRVSCEVFATDLGPNERFADAVTRIGVEEIARRCVVERECLEPLDNSPSPRK